MPRPKEFDRTEALRAGMGVFWRQGYNATTTDDLRLAMRIGRQSFYDTFGDKRRCYLEALRAYVVQEVSVYLATLRGADAPLDGLRNLLLAPTHWNDRRRSIGCMAMNALSEFGAEDADVSAALAPAQLTLQQAIVGLLTEAKTNGEVPLSLNQQQAAQAFACTRGGMLVAAKAGTPAADLRAIAEFTIDRLKL